MKKMTLNNIYEWPLMTRMLLLGLIFAATFYLGYRYDISKKVQALQRAAQEELALKEQIQLVVHKNKVVKAQVSQLPVLQAELAKWKSQLVTYKDMPKILNQILKIGGDNHLYFSLFSPGASVEVKIAPVASQEVAGVATTASAASPPATPPPPAIPGAPTEVAPPVDAAHTITLAKVPIKVVVVGDYHQISDFISQIANMSSIVMVGDFTISNENQTALLGDKLAKQAAAQHLLSAELMLDVYHLPESK